ncbi:uncharacterized protein AC631_04953 [Debaryomyces fabryi]|uniref:G-protein coupled receptors family 1 profile domain-containing protein n=1 Tax=Debaryomyces fabryi TaxID=58627 RepID=A0A0V1PT12_9ASCO|nr:uncharacterized protein AC631_04953 [Debaryomyces fabryi]KRZ99282.1 hypothetical protein AC631_04953 [Debaryomyces fabryi]CUM50687.1 unnamed protein product [Debaryomyces fabryi]
MAVCNIQCLLKKQIDLIRRDSADLSADLNRYTHYQADRQRVISIVSSSISIFAGLVGIYFFLAISDRKRIFRHHLIIFLILYDWIKAICLLLYPLRVLVTSAAYYNVGFCRVVGFFTAFSIEGSDLAIISFAIHLALLIYRPNDRIKRGNNYEGGLYRYRYVVYAVDILLPILLASLAFIDDLGYTPLTNWCYIPSRPIWYRLVLSWIPRYLIMVSIIVIYICIYQHVTKQYSNVGRSFENNTPVNEATLKQKLSSFMRFLTFDLTNNKIHNADNDSQEDNLNTETVDKFKVRRIQAQKQISAIFIYPVSYLFLWIFPTIVHGLDFRYGLSIRPFVWLNGIAAFMQPFNCTVDTLVFLIREKPWRITTIKVDSSLTEVYEYPLWRRMLSFLPLFKLPEPLETRHLNSLDSKNEISTSENANSREISSIISDTTNTGNIGHVLRSNHQHALIDNIASSRSTESNLTPLQGERKEYNQIIAKNKDHAKHHNTLNLSNNQAIPETADELGFEEFLKTEPETK